MNSEITRTDIVVCLGLLTRKFKDWFKSMQVEEEEEDEEDGHSVASHSSASQPASKKRRASDDQDSLASFPSVPPSPASAIEAPAVHSSRSAAPPAQRHLTGAPAQSPAPRTIFHQSDEDMDALEDDVFQSTPRNASQSSKRTRSRPTSKGSRGSRGSSGTKKKKKRSKKAKTASSASYSVLAPMQGN